MLVLVCVVSDTELILFNPYRLTLGFDFCSKKSRNYNSNYGLRFINLIEQCFNVIRHLDRWTEGNFRCTIFGFFVAFFPCSFSDECDMTQLYNFYNCCKL
jgi:hypothetical protein